MDFEMDIRGVAHELVISRAVPDININRAQRQDRHGTS